MKNCKLIFTPEIQDKFVRLGMEPMKYSNEDALFVIVVDGKYCGVSIMDWESNPYPQVLNTDFMEIEE
jgi:hypothetical protein